MSNHQYSAKRSFVVGIGQLAFMFDLCERCAANSLTDNQVAELFDMFRTHVIRHISVVIPSREIENVEGGGHG